jgi:signal transduction histidine kinase
VSVRGDAVRIRQLLLRLIGNAAKASSRSEVGLHVVQDGPGWVAIQVRDKGRGMSEQELKLALEPFGVSGGAIPPAGGTGLSLALSRRLCERMGGEFHVDTKPGEGARFTVRLREAAPETVTA